MSTDLPYVYLLDRGNQNYARSNNRCQGVIQGGTLGFPPYPPDLKK